MSKVTFRDTYISNCSFSNNIYNSTFARCKISHCTFTLGRLAGHAKFLESTFSRCSFKNYIFHHALIEKCKFHSTMFSLIQFINANINNTNLSNHHFLYTYFKHTTFTSSDLRNTKFKSWYIGPTRQTGEFYYENITYEVRRMLNKTKFRNNKMSGSTLEPYARRVLLSRR